MTSQTRDRYQMSFPCLIRLNVVGMTPSVLDATESYTIRCIAVLQSRAVFALKLYNTAYTVFKSCTIPSPETVRYGVQSSSKLRKQFHSVAKSYKCTMYTASAIVLRNCTLWLTLGSNKLYTTVVRCHARIILSKRHFLTTERKKSSTVELKRRTYQTKVDYDCTFEFIRNNNVPACRD